MNRRQGAPTTDVEGVVMAMNRAQLTSLRLLKSASARLADVGVPRPLRHIQCVRGGGV
jgi:hypothetical protein